VINPYESVNICWVEEAANVSKSSWDVLIPTIRKESSEDFGVLQLRAGTDTYKRSVTRPPSGATVIKINVAGV
jgi:phage terminase large subunit